jgi:ubiquinone/menaquinone biosynthesis C-methylase UbiE
MIEVFKMRIVERIVQDLGTYLSGKKVLEIACGNAHFR